MLSVIRWSPFDEVVSLRQAMDRLVEDSFVRPWRREGSWTAGLPVDMYETKDALVVKARVPGVDPEDVELTIHGDSLTIKAELRSDATQDDAKNWNWYRQELFYGSVSRSLSLPTLVEPEKAEATFRHGELTLLLPKAEAVKPRSIKIKTVS
jgi:HSP20 family protein